VTRPLSMRLKGLLARADVLAVLVDAAVVLENTRASDEAVFDAASVLEEVAARFRMQRTLNPQEDFAARQKRRRANPEKPEPQNTRHHE